jgi:hypothetical protein
MEICQGDEKIIEKLFNYLVDNFPRLEFKVKVKLKELLPEPENKWLKSFWKNNSHADISVFRHGKLVCIIEPGGWYHAKDKKQKVRDTKKDKICQENGVNVLRFFNNVVENDLENIKFRRLVKKYVYGSL